MNATLSITLNEMQNISENFSVLKILLNSPVTYGARAGFEVSAIEFLKTT